MTAQGPRKGEPSSSSVRNGFRTQPAYSVRGSSRRIMTLRFRPANIRVINRRVSPWAVIRLLSKTQNPRRSKLTSRIVIPPSRPSKSRSMPERCSPSRVRFAAPNCGAPLTAPLRSGQTLIATGGSGGITSRIAAPPGQKRRLPGGSRLDSKKICQALTGLDRVAPYQNRSFRASCAERGPPI